MVVELVPSELGAAQKHHAVIAGTGRAGTSFLVRFLGACGLDVGSEDAAFHERARAGLEHNLLDERAPYVVKDPWLFAYCDSVDPRAIAVDALLVPVRELMATATSRILQERAVMAEGPWAGLPPSQVNGMVPGGAVYSLDPHDEARVLAVGFHQLIYWATATQIPLFLLEFPRMVRDRDYLIDTLWPWLRGLCDRRVAHKAFAAVEAEHQLRRTHDRIAELEGSIVQRDATLGEVRLRLESVTAEAGALRQTLSWRVTRPLRRLRRVAGSGTRPDRRRPAR